tara:strand:+ start:274 stop:522 length:249 start_codon:yes stop_codon:yes gene_type:complete
MPKEKPKSQLLAGKFLEIATNSIDLYYQDERKKATKRRWTIARTKLKSLSSLKLKNLRKIKTTNDIKTTNNKQSMDNEKTDK